MARGRMVNITIATDKRLAKLSMTAEFIYLKTLPHLDRDGLILGDAELLWAKVATRRPELLADTEAYIGEWLEQELVIAYDTPDGRALFFPSFAKNQVGMRYDREPESTIPPPPGYRRTDAGLVPIDVTPTSGSIPADIRQSSGSLSAEVKGKEVKREVKGEVKGKENPLPPAPAGGGVGRQDASKMQALNAILEPGARRLLADRILAIAGLLDLANVDNTAGQQVLAEAHEAALAVHAIGYRTPADLEPVEHDWYQIFPGTRGERPTIKQFVAQSSKSKAGANGNGKEHPYATPQRTATKQPPIDTHDNQVALRRLLGLGPDDPIPDD